ncbi:mechanosensitive ion channel protein 6-like [Forsythia ovata]|uniref:Mechanosensitive ion channel protein 6-like n=1 Tax=Forsythia ovata TaxID=205694 RepID=A0ABD1UV85_9LAMI
MSPAANNKDFDFITEYPLSRIAESPSTNYGQLTPKEVRVSFNDNMAAVQDSNRPSNTEQDEVLVCRSNSSFRRKSNLLRTKTKSRLPDPPENNTKSQIQRMTKSQVLRKGSEVDEDDPFLD